MLKTKKGDQLSTKQKAKLVNAQRKFTAIAKRKRLPKALSDEECKAYPLQTLIEGLAPKVNEMLDLSPLRKDSSKTDLEKALGGDEDKAKKREREREKLFVA